MMAGEKGNDANIVLFVGFVWVLCTYALGLTSMVMDGVKEAWIVGFTIFFVMAGGIKWADHIGQQSTAPKDDTATSEE